MSDTTERGRSVLDEHMYETSVWSRVNRGRKIGYHTHRHTDTDGTPKRLKQVKVTGPADSGWGQTRNGCTAAAAAVVVVVVEVAVSADEEEAASTRRRAGNRGDLNDLLSIL